MPKKPNKPKKRQNVTTSDNAMLRDLMGRNKKLVENITKSGLVKEPK